MNGYQPRLTDPAVHTALEESPVVLLEGANGCGKATTAAQVAKSYLRLRHPWHRREETRIDNFASIMQGEPPRLFSETQAVPGLVLAAGLAAGIRPGQFILTESAGGDAAEKITGNIRRIRMRPMSLYESGESSGEVSLRALFDGNFTPGAPNLLRIGEAAAAMTRGGWPAALQLPQAEASLYASSHLGAILGAQLSGLPGGGSDPRRMAALMRSLAQHNFTITAARAIRITAASFDSQTTLTDQAVSRALTALRRSYLTEDIAAWLPPLRTRTRIRSALKRQFTDPSIACAVMGFQASDLMKDVQWFTRLFKSMCVRDLRVYADVLDGEVLHYRDASKLKTDAVILLHDGRWGAVEIVLDLLGNDPAVTRLLKLRDKVDTEAAGEPAFLMVLTLSGEAYRRKDGVYVVPVGCLGP